MNNLDQSIFRSYDIRGIYPEQINPEAVKIIAQAYIKMLAEKFGKEPADLRVVVGRDVRVASGPLKEMAVDIFISYGLTVDDLGLVSVNDFYFACGHYGYDGGIMFTASHNPPQYGGMKMAFASPNRPDKIDFVSGKEFYSFLSALELPLDYPKTAGTLTDKDVSSDHLEHILSFVDVTAIKPLTVVVDAGGGMNGPMSEKIFDRLPCQLVPMFFDYDSSFSRRPPNPLDEGASDKIKAKILETKADLGVMFDVDGDRMFLVDEKGEFISGDMTLLIIAKALLARVPKAGVVYNLICSHAVPELVTKWGGRPIRSEVGFINLARQMEKDGGIMSGEVSGHFAFKDNYFADSAFIALLLVLESLSQSGQSLSSVIDGYSLYVRGDEINVTVDSADEVLERIRDKYRDNILDEIDGITVEFDDWWFNVRPSNTESLLRLTVEAKTAVELKQYQTELLNIINN